MATSLAGPRCDRVSVETQIAKSDARYERKYNLAEGRHQDFVNYLFSLEFSRQHPDRIVNSVYFDGHDRPAFWEKIEGVSDRTKYRVRWYGDDAGPITAKLEVKKRRNEVGTKQNLPLPHLQNAPGLYRFLRTPDMAQILERVGQFNLRPIVQIKYSREYFEHRSIDIRATVDRHIMGAALSAHGQQTRPHFRGVGADVMELKYGLDLDDTVRSNLIGSNFPFRLQKFSKYSMACGALQL